MREIEGEKFSDEDDSSAFVPTVYERKKSNKYLQPRPSCRVCVTPMPIAGFAKVEG